MDARHCCVCGRELETLDVYVQRAQGKICSRCVLDRGIAIGGPREPRPVWPGRRIARPAAPRLAVPIFPAV